MKLILFYNYTNLYSFYSTGTIDRSEFQELSNNFDSEKLSEEELSAIFDAADIDNSGQIAYGEFLAATLDTNVFLREVSI